MAAVSAIINGGFHCNQPDSPDDMMLGLWLRGLGIPIVHSALFHQVGFPSIDIEITTA